MLRTDLTDHRGTDDARLLSALADGDAIALAEAYHRTITAAHACARRLLASPVEIEALMRAVYSDLWDDPPVDTSLEGWVRARCFNLGAGYLRQRQLRAPSPSLARFTSGIEADGHGGNDTLEQMIADLTEQQQAALVRAHDQGIRTTDQDDPDAGWSLLHAMLALASPLTDDERHAAEMCSSGVALANWTFGLLPPHEAATVPGTAAEPTPCGRLAGVLRRARRRFEPLPPTPDLGHRVLASVLSNGAGRQPSQAPGSSLDSDLRVAYADLGRSQPPGDTPTSSLDMHIPSPVPPPATEPALPTDNGRRATRGWDTGEEPIPFPGRGSADAPARVSQEAQLRAAGPPPALPPSQAPPASTDATHPFPPARPAPPAPDEQASDDLVRMPLRRLPQRPGLPPPDDAHATAPLPKGDPSILRPGTPVDEEATIPPTGLRDRHDERERRGQPPRGLRGMEVDAGPAESPLSAEEQRGSRAQHDTAAGSPLRRPTPPPRGLDTGSRPPPPPRGLDTGSRPAPPPRGLDTGSRPAPPPRGLEGGPRPAPPRPLDSHPGLQRDDSNPRIGDAFGTEDMTIPPSNAATAAAMPSMRRPQHPPTSSMPPSAPPAPSAPQAQGPTIEAEGGGGPSILRWVVVIVLVALGAAFGIWLGQMMIA